MYQRVKMKLDLWLTDMHPHMQMNPCIKLFPWAISTPVRMEMKCVRTDVVNSEKLKVMKTVADVLVDVFILMNTWMQPDVVNSGEMEVIDTDAV